LFAGGNRWRGRAAGQVFSVRDDLGVASAGLDPACGNPLTPDLVDWAEVIFVMEKTHRAKLQRQFRSHLKGARVVCLDIPDDFEFMDPELVRILETRVPRHLR